MFFLSQNDFQEIVKMQLIWDELDLLKFVRDN